MAIDSDARALALFANSADGISAAGGALSGGVYNLTPENIARFRLAKEKSRNGVANARIVAVGDSTVAIGSTQAGPFVNVLSWPTKLAARLTAIGLNARGSAAFGNLGFDTATLPTVDTRRTLGAGWVVPTSNIPYGPGGVILYNGTTTNAYSVAFTETFEAVDIYYMNHLGNGSFNVNLDGGSDTLVNTGTGSDAMGKVTITGSLATHTVNIARASGDVYIIGVHAYCTTTPDISVINLGWSNAKVSDLVRSAKAWEPLNAYPAFDAALYVIMVGINDWNAGTSLSTFSTQVQSLITTLKSDPADVMIIGQHETGGVATPAVQQTYRAVLKALAIANDCVYVDLRERFGPYTGTGGQLSGSQWMRDASHMTENGNSDIVTDLLKVLNF